MSSAAHPQIVCQLVGGPKTFQVPDGEWTSAIGRQSVGGPVEVGLRGLAGDSVADTKNHGSPDQAISCHSESHYQFWNNEFDLNGKLGHLELGALGENWTLSDCDESTVCIGDIFRVGTCTVQVSQPRTPCWKQEAKTGLDQLVNRTIETLKTGFYLRVLEPGTVTIGDSLILQNRPNTDLTVQGICRFRFHGEGKEIAIKAIDVPELSEGWRNSLSRRLASTE